MGKMMSALKEEGGMKKGGDGEGGHEEGEEEDRAERGGKRSQRASLLTVASAC